MKSAIILIVGMLTGFIICKFLVPDRDSDPVSQVTTDTLQQRKEVTFSGKTTKENPGFATVASWTPISYETVLQYQQGYDDAPLFYDRISGKPYEGFTIDSKGMQEIRNHPEFMQLYLRLGRKPDGNYTILIRPLDERGRFIQDGPVARADDQNRNYDQLDPCPDRCP